jgi:hypothetical protein
LGDAEIGDAGLHDDAAVGDVDVDDPLELAQAKQHAILKRQCAPGE